jgi:hypothetical protein
MKHTWIVEKYIHYQNTETLQSATNNLFAFQPKPIFFGITYITYQSTKSTKFRLIIENLIVGRLRTKLNYVFKSIFFISCFRLSKLYILKELSLWVDLFVCLSMFSTFLSSCLLVYKSNRSWLSPYFCGCLCSYQSVCSSVDCLSFLNFLLFQL